MAITSESLRPPSGELTDRPVPQTVVKAKTLIALNYSRNQYKTRKIGLNECQVHCRVHDFKRGERI